MRSDGGLALLGLGIVAAGCLGAGHEAGTGLQSLSPTLNSEVDLPGKIDATYLPRLRQVQRGEFTGAAGIPIRYLVQGPGGGDALVLVNGRTESFLYYLEVLDDLSRLPLTVYTYDHRGQGLSGRILTREPQKGYVEGFEYYIADLTTFMDTVVAAGRHRRVVVFGHSMGGAVATLYSMQFPQRVHALVLSAPMFGIRLPVTEPNARVLATSAPPTAWARGQGPFDPFARFQGNDLTSSPARFEMVRGLATRAPEVQLGGVTYGWLRAALEATTAIQLGARNLVVPTLILQADVDRVVDDLAQVDVCSRAPSCRTKKIPGSLHELLLDADGPRNTAMTELYWFLMTVLS